jgi:hypothetical protein
MGVRGRRISALLRFPKVNIGAVFAVYNTRH